MSEQTPFAFGKLIPGFDFLQKLTSGGGSAASGIGHWVAPTVNVEELEQRITELKAVQFWLEQNVLAVKATVQALEVQKMTLATLRGMNLNVAEVAKAFAMPRPEASASPAPAATDAAGRWPFQNEPAAPAPAEPEPAAEAAPAAQPDAPDDAPKKPKTTRRRAGAEPAGDAAPAAAAGMADAMQWWGALTQQFQHIAAQTLREAARAAPAALAQAPAPDQPADAPAKKPAASKKASGRGAARKKAARPAKKKAAARAPSDGWVLPSPPRRDRS